MKIKNIALLNLNCIAALLRANFIGLYIISLFRF